MKAEVKPKETTRTILIDEFAELHNRLVADLRRYEKLKNQVSALANLEPGVESVTLKGINWFVDYTKRADTNQCLLPPEEYVAVTGDWTAIKVGVTEAKKVLTQEQFETIFSKVPGSRRFNGVRINI